ncbi:MAG: MBL fold metallo-hydrolase [Candidatus Yonathbacteria bacterium]|nr:MBL fold metallo-hydrolase [Candidatus Yonathbacteria bacterium]
MQNAKKHGRLFFLALFFVVNVFIWSAVFREERDGVLTVAFLDVGQGDAIFIEAPNGNQVLLDGGPNKRVLRELARMMPFYDRSLDVVIASHPDKDHVGGLPAVLARYDVGMAIDPGVEHDTSVYQEFERLVKEHDVERIRARRGQIIWLDQSVYLEILFPDRDPSGWDTNDASIVARLVYGETSFMLTGDSPQKMEQYIVGLEGEALASDILKLGHHGSKTSTSELFLGFVSPAYAIISAGKDNQYGHPHKEVLDLVERFGIPMLATYETGSIIMRTDGTNISID